MCQQGGMAARMVTCYKRNNNKLLLNTCKLDMKTKKPLHLVFIYRRTPLHSPLRSLSLQNSLES